MKSIGSQLQSFTQFGKSSPVPGRTAQTLLALPEQGQLLKALVLEMKAEKNFLLQIGDNQLLARTEAPLQPGQTLQLQLVATSPQVELRIVNDTLQQVFGRPLTLVGNTIDINALFNLLQQPQSLLEGLSPHSRQALESFFSLQQNAFFTTTESGGSTLKQLVDQLGISLEHLLARGEARDGALTLKAALLELISNFKVGSQIHDSASRTLATLEFFQLAQLHTDSSQQFILPLPLSFIEQGFLLVEQREREEEGGGGYEQQEYRFSLFLKMTELGNLRIDLFHIPEGLFIRFHTDSQEKSDFLAGFTDDLRQALTESPILGLSFAADAPDPTSELVRRIVPEGRAMLDTLA